MKHYLDAEKAGACHNGREARRRAENKKSRRGGTIDVPCKGRRHGRIGYTNKNTPPDLPYGKWRGVVGAAPTGPCARDDGRAGAAADAAAGPNKLLRV